MKLKSFKDADIAGKRVFIRMDYNVPIKDRNVIDNYKIESSFSTIVDVYNMKPKCIILGTHLRRPDGVFQYKDSIIPVFYELKTFIKDNFQENIVYVMSNTVYRENVFVMIENLRFFPLEVGNRNDEEIDPDGSYRLDEFIENNVDLVVVDAFGCLHRHAYSITQTLKPSYAGNLIMKEVDVATSLMNDGVDLIIIGGCKVKDKIKLIESLIRKCKSIFIVGGLAFSFLKYKFKREVGKSIIDEGSVDMINHIYLLAEANDVEIHLPEDYVVDINGHVAVVEEIPANGCGYDIGPKTIDKLRAVVSKVKNIFWNGTPGVFEDDRFNKGSKALVDILGRHRSYGKVVAGGGETAASVRKFFSLRKFYHVSTGGGVFLKILSGEELPGLKNIIA